MTKILTQSFFARPVVTVAKELIGKYLVRNYKGKSLALQITEVEAYDGPEDLACHGRFGKTDRNQAMFGPAGTMYIYLIYGAYWMLNIATDEPGYPAAVLLRAAGHITGPGKLTKLLEIDKRFNNKLLSPENELWIEDRNFSLDEQLTILATPRIGIDYAGPIWREKPYRFILAENKKIEITSPALL